MWIKYICLENFKNIKTGLKANRLEIDFSKRENVICLLTGPNGMGKTSLLSCLTPFATLGNLDVRDNNQLIIDKKPGYKRIIIMNGSDEIDIEHFYAVNKDTHSVKSYFKLNGNELNTNGNVTSFKSVVKEVLFIDMDYLKLIRLGDNVTNLIKLKSTDRKNFMSKMLPSVDNYLKMYTKVSGDVRDLKVVMSHLLDKLNKLNITDVNIHKNKIKEITDGISFYEKEIEKASSEIYNFTYKIEALDLSDTFKEDLRKLRKKESKYRLALEEKESNFDVEKMSKLLEKKKERIQYLTAHIDFTSIECDKYLNEYDELSSELDELKRNLNIEIENSNLVSLKDYLKSLLKKDKDNESVSFPISLKITKQEYDDFVVAIKNLQRELNITYEFGRDPVRDVIKMINEDVNVSEFITASLISIENKKNKSNKTYLDTLVDKYSRMKKPDCGERCILKDLYQDIISIKDLKPVKETNRSAEYYQIVKVVYDNIYGILSRLQNLKNIIQKLPDEYQVMFMKKKVFKHIENCELIYDDKKINELLTILGEYDNYIKLQEEISITKDKIKEEETSSKIEYFSEKIEKTNEKLKSVNEKRNDSLEEIKKEKEDLVLLENEIDSIGTTLSAIESYTEVKDEMIELENKTNYFESFFNKRKELIHSKDELEHKKEFLINEKGNAEIAYNEYLKLNKELNRCKEMYDNYLLIRSSTSTKEGIPLLHIEMYLKDTKELANDLLDIVYNGDIMIDDFNIGGTDFLIPYIKNGTVIPDISYASQGEQSFLNMAISFALSIQNLTEYNIPLLDEVDATFDQEKREAAIAVIEKQNEIIQSEQTFIISHNNMYDQYPVDLIDFAHLEESKFDIKLS